MVTYRARSQPGARSSFCPTFAGFAVVALAACAAMPAGANDLGENSAWQFRTSTDRANQAAILDLIAKRRGGYYAAPIYNTNIARQVNCSIGASAIGNSNGQSAVANTATVTGASSSSTGNQSSSAVDAGNANGRVSSTQGNSGEISSGVIGGTETSIRGNPSQALNSTQSDSGSQSASVRNSNACSFAALN
jgi:hypothetical protein